MSVSLHVATSLQFFRCRCQPESFALVCRFDALQHNTNPLQSIVRLRTVRQSLMKLAGFQALRAKAEAAAIEVQHADGLRNRTTSSKYRSTFVVIRYRWHPLYGKRWFYCDMSAGGDNESFTSR
jgi:hypothetical protein